MTFLLPKTRRNIVDYMKVSGSSIQRIKNLSQFCFHPSLVYNLILKIEIHISGYKDTMIQYNGFINNI